MFPVSPINFLQHREHEDGRRKQRRVRRRVLLLLCIAAIAAVLSSRRLRQPILPQPVERAIARLEQFNLFHLATSADQNLQGEETGRINILLMGIGGGNHEGPMLTDTILLASINLPSKRLGLLSIPRDLSVPVSGGGWRKINGILSNSEARLPGSGNEALLKTVEDITGQQIPYSIRIDFDGFVKLIDAIGGIVIDVEQTLDDSQYPIEGRELDPVYANRFERLLIPKGRVTMDGTLALKYVRSRHAAGSEGSDFARSRRQQKFLRAIKEKIFSFETIFSPRRLKSIGNILSAHIASNIQPWEALRLRAVLQTVDTANIIQPVLDNSPGSLLADARGEDGAYLLVPKGGNFEKLKELERTIFTSPSTPQVLAPSKGPSIILLNGTDIEGFATRTAKQFEEAGILAQTVGNAPVKGYEESILYVREIQPTTDPLMAKIQTILPATVTTILPPWANNYEADMILVLGSKP